MKRLAESCLGKKMRNAFFVFQKQNVGLLKTYSLPLILVFTLVNSELKNFSSDKVILKWLIINDLMCHLSLVTFAFTLSFLHFALCLWHDFCVMEVCLKFEKFCMV